MQIDQSVLASTLPCNTVQATSPLPVENGLPNSSGRSQLADSAATSELVRRRRDTDDRLVEQCDNGARRPVTWARAMIRRLRVVVDHLQHRNASPESEPPAAATVAAAAPVRLPPWRSVNEFGFLERNDFGRLYIVQQVHTVRALAHAALATGRVGDDGHGLPTQDDRYNPSVQGLAGQRGFTIGRRAIEGDVVDAYLSEDAARRAAIATWGERGRDYPMYEIDARTLTGVSMGDNRINNPQFHALINADVRYAVNTEDDIMFYTASAYFDDNDMLVQLQLQGNMAGRLHRIE